MLTKLHIIMSVLFALTGYSLGVWLCWRYAGVSLAFMQTLDSLGIVVAAAFCLLLIFLGARRTA